MSVLGLAAWLLLASPAELRLAQVVPLDDAVTVTVRQGDQLVWVSEPLRGGQWAAYREVPAGPLTVQCAAGEQHAEGLIDLSAGGRFTLVVHRLLGDPFLLLADPPPTLTSDTTAVRFVQAVPDHDTLWLRWRRPRGTQWHDESGGERLAYPSSGEYATVAPGPVTLRLLALGDDGGELETIEDFSGLRLLPGVALTVVVWGLHNTDSDRDLPLTLLALMDAVVGDGS